MQKPFKISTFVMKLLIFTIFLSSFGLSAARAKDSFKQEDIRVLSQVRLSLWYQGLKKDKEVSENEVASFKEVEELRIPMEKYLKDSLR